MSRIIKGVKEEIETYTEPRDVFLSALSAVVLIAFSFLAYSRLTTTLIQTRTVSADVFIVYYGFPFAIMGILQPIPGMQTAVVNIYRWREGNSIFSILWDGILLDFAIFFILAFLTIYLYRRFIER